MKNKAPLFTAEQEAEERCPAKSCGKTISESGQPSRHTINGRGCCFHCDEHFSQACFVCEDLPDGFAPHGGGKAAE